MTPEEWLRLARMALEKWLSRMTKTGGGIIREKGRKEFRTEDYKKMHILSTLSSSRMTPQPIGIALLFFSSCISLFLYRP